MKKKKSCDEKKRLSNVNLDEAGCRVTPLLKVLLPVLLLDFEGKARTQDALRGHREVTTELYFTHIHVPFISNVQYVRFFTYRCCARWV